MFFKIFPIKIYNTCASVWTNCRSTFATLIAVSPKHAFWTHQKLLQVSESVDLLFYFLLTGIKRNHSVPSQYYMADDSSNRCFQWSKMQLFEPMCERSRCCGEELANKWLCTTLNWLLCVVLMLRLRHVQFFRKNRR